MAVSGEPVGRITCPALQYNELLGNIGEGKSEGKLPKKAENHAEVCDYPPYLKFSRQI